MRTFSARLRALPSFIIREVAPVLFHAGERVAVSAQLSITEGSVSGAGHIPSAPGEPPNNDTGVLANNIRVYQPKPSQVLVVSEAPYSLRHEIGDSKTPARPFMGPAADREERLVVRSIQKAVARSIARHQRR